MILALQIVGWLLLVGALLFTAIVAVVHERGRHRAWVRVVRSVNGLRLSRGESMPWRQLVANALTDGYRVREILFSYDDESVELLVDADEVREGWIESSAGAERFGVRVTVPGEDWQEGLALARPEDGAKEVPTEYRQLCDGLGVSDLNWQQAKVRVRAAQVTIDVPADVDADVSVSPVWVENLRSKDSTTLYVIAATIGALGAVLTLTGVGIAVGVVVFVALSGVCKFIFMSRRSDPTREEYLQNY